MTVATNDVVLQMRLRQESVSGGHESSGSTSDLRRREAADSELEEVFRHHSSNHLPTAVGGHLARVLDVSTRLVASRQNRPHQFPIKVATCWAVLRSIASAMAIRTRSPKR